MAARLDSLVGERGRRKTENCWMENFKKELFRQGSYDAPLGRKGPREKRKFNNFMASVL